MQVSNSYFWTTKASVKEFCSKNFANDEQWRVRRLWTWATEFLCMYFIHVWFSFIITFWFNSDWKAGKSAAHKEQQKPVRMPYITNATLINKIFALNKGKYHTSVLYVRISLSFGPYCEDFRLTFFLLKSHMPLIHTVCIVWKRELPNKFSIQQI